MKRRLTIARSLINEPEILLLDEPTTGLDPQARHVVWDRLYRLKQQGVTLVLTTHYMDEAEQLCDRLVVMDRARIAAEGSPRELIEAYSTPEVLELRFRIAEHEQAAEKLADVPADRMEVLADRILLYVPDGDVALASVRALGLEPLTSPGPAQHPGGRLPPADRPAAGGLMAAPVAPRLTSRAAWPRPRRLPWQMALREFRFWLVNYRRTWRGSIYSSVLSPVLYLGAMGLGLGTLVDAHGPPAWAGSATWTSSRPACWPPPRCRRPWGSPPIRSSGR